MIGKYTDNEKFVDLPKKEQNKVAEWIIKNFIPYDIKKHRGKRIERRTSYALKHLMDDEIAVYVTNNQFKEATLQVGYKPIDTKELNWEYHILEIRR